MNKEEIQEILDELHTVRPEMLDEKGKRLFETIMKIADERDLYKSIIEEVREYITGYESTSILQSLDNIENNRGLDEKTMIEMDRRYLIVHDKILEILDKVD